MPEHDEIFATGSKAFAFIQTLDVKVGKAKFYKDIQKGVLACQQDKSILRSDLLAYAESLKPTQSGLTDAEKMRRGRQHLADLVRGLLAHLVVTPALNAKIEKWLQDAEELLPGSPLDSVCRALEKARETKPAPAPAPSTNKQRRTELLLQGIALGMLAKGKLYRKDSIFLSRWIRNHPSLRDKPDVAELLREADRLNLAHPDDFNEWIAPLQRKLNTFIKASGLQVPNVKLKGEKWRGAANVIVAISQYDDMFDQVTQIDFSANFCFTGKFESVRSREEYEQAVVRLGGVIKDHPRQGGKNYLIVGSVSNPQWRGTKCGTKILDAIEYRRIGCDMTIVHEDIWRECLIKEQRARGIIPPAPEATGQFRPPWPIESLFFLIPPPDMDTIQLVLRAEQVRVVESSQARMDAIIMPVGLCSASEEQLAIMPEVGEKIATDVASARDSGMLVIDEEEFRRWIWWKDDLNKSD